MGFIEDEEIDLIHAYKRTHKTLLKNFRCADNYHVLAKVFLPGLLGPMVGAHLATEALDALIQIDFQEFILLKDQRDRVHLRL